MITLTTMAATTSSSSWCQKFEPNIFNKAKCQNCFKPKEQHSSEALESNKVGTPLTLTALAVTTGGAVMFMSLDLDMT